MCDTRASLPTLGPKDSWTTYADGYGYTINTVGTDSNQGMFSMSVDDSINNISTDDVKPSLLGERRGGERDSAT